MPDSNTASLPTLRRRRPTDATGCFWAFIVVFILFGVAVFTKGSMAIFGFGILIAVPISFALLIERRLLDSEIIRLATDWCRLHFPGLGKAPIVDFLVALAHKSEIDWDTLRPTSTLTQFNVTRRFGKAINTYEGPDFPGKWMKDLAKDARIKLTENAEFGGTTLEDAIQFLVKFEEKPER